MAQTGGMGMLKIDIKVNHFVLLILGMLPFGIQIYFIVRWPRLGVWVCCKLELEHRLHHLGCMG